MLLLDEHIKLNTTSLNKRNINDDSLSNNTSQFTSANNRGVNLSSLTTYHKMLNYVHVLRMIITIKLEVK